MGVITALSLKELNQLFCNYVFIKIEPTSSGTIDTTYRVFTETKSYILKKYEREIPKKINADSQLLERLHASGLNVPRLIEQHDGWHLYKKLDGLSPTRVHTYHIRALARFMAQLHAETQKIKSGIDFIESYDVNTMLRYAKHHHYSYFKKLESLENYQAKSDGLIHGDIFRDNTVFDAQKIGVFDFIDAADGEFLFDIAVALVSFNPAKHELYLNLFIKTYNQHAPKKVNKKDLKAMIKRASGFYALLRIYMHKNAKKAKELL
ncbi:MAG: phosphotransferase [Campylobacterota bacterium]|nr:phosphotransferase [Campylobacterota bacterium]